MGGAKVKSNTWVEPIPNIAIFNFNTSLYFGTLHFLNICSQIKLTYNIESMCREPKKSLTYKL